MSNISKSILFVLAFLAIGCTKYFQNKGMVSPESSETSGVVSYKLKVGEVPSIKIGNLDFKAVATTLRESSSKEIRMGMPFFKDKIQWAVFSKVSIFLYIYFSNKN